MSTMKVYLDGCPIDGAGSTLASALDAVATSLDGRLVIEAEADGSPVPPEHLSQPPGTDPYARRLDLKSENAGALVRFSLLEAADALEGAREDHATAAKSIDVGDTSAAMGALGPILEVWSAAARTIDLARQIEQIDLPGRVADGRSLDDVADTLNRMLVEIKRCLADQDLVRLADVLAYDMTKAVDDWAAMLRGLAGSVESQPSSRPHGE